MSKIKWYEFLLTAIALFVLPQMAYPDSDVRGTLYDNTTVENAATVAVGEKSVASIGGIHIKNSRFDGQGDIEDQRPQ